MSDGNGNKIAALKRALQKAEAQIAALKMELAQQNVTIETN